MAFYFAEDFVKKHGRYPLFITLIPPLPSKLLMMCIFACLFILTHPETRLKRGNILIRLFASEDWSHLLKCMAARDKQSILKGTSNYRLKYQYKVRRKEFL